MKWVVLIAVIWTVADLLAKLYFSGTGRSNAQSHRILTPGALWLRLAIVFSVSLYMGYLLVFVLRERFREYPLWKTLLYKSAILVGASVGLNFLIHVTYILVIWGWPADLALFDFYYISTRTTWLLEKSAGWMGIFLFTQLFLEINEKYAPGVFFAILLGRYSKPRGERRIVLFLDLRDSTPIAESLGSSAYFTFIRDFIFYVSTALLEYDGGIYQYVGDEVVAYWKSSRRNAMKCVSALVEARRQLQRRSEEFRRKYNFTPEFRAGIHEGEVTVGEIGIVKKDLAMSGDTVNTAARIRTACSELKQKFLVSKEVRDMLPLQAWQVESVGEVDLKGKSGGMELFALKV